jgi:hypothetical protein
MSDRYTRNPAGVKDGAECYRTIGGVRWLWWSEPAAWFKRSGVRHRSPRDGQGVFIHPEDDAAAEAVIMQHFKDNPHA